MYILFFQYPWHINGGEIDKVKADLREARAKLNETQHQFTVTLQELEKVNFFVTDNTLVREQVFR